MVQAPDSRSARMVSWPAGCWPARCRNMHMDVVALASDEYRLQMHHVYPSAAKEIMAVLGFS